MVLNISFYEFMQMKQPDGLSRKGKKRENYLLAKIAGMLTILEEYQGDLIMEKVQKLLKDPLYYYKDNHEWFEKGLHTLDWLLKWESHNDYFMEVLELTFNDDVELLKLFRREKSFVFDFLDNIKHVKFMKINISDYE